MPKTLDEHIEMTPGVMGGKPRIAGHRIKVADVAIWHLQLGMSVEEICSEYQLTNADVHAALAYYFDHREEIDRQIAEEEVFVEEFRSRNPSLLDEKIKQMKKGGNGASH